MVVSLLSPSDSVPAFEFAQTDLETIKTEIESSLGNLKNCLQLGLTIFLLDDD